MFNLVNAKKELDTHQQAIRTMADKGLETLSAEETAALEDHVSKAESLKKQIDLGERALALGAQAAGAVPPAPHQPAHVHDRAEDEPFRSLGDQLLDVLESHRNQQVTPRLRKMMETRAATGMSESVPADGGFFVQKEQSDTILQKVYSVGGLIARCRRYPLGGNKNGVKLPGVDETSRADGYRIGGVRGYWVDEAGTITSSKPKFYMVELSLNKVAALVYLTDELVQDAAVLERFVMDSVPDELRFKVEDAIINGDGAGKPLGILKAGCLVSVAKETNQPGTTFKYENAKKMWSRMWAPSRANSVWLINQDVEPELYGMTVTVGTGGAPVYQPAGGASGAQYSTLFNRPIMPVEYCATLGTKGDAILADMSQFYLIEKGMQSALSVHVAFTTDQQVLRFIYRVDAQPVWKSALTPKSGSSNTLSPFVTLDARS